jgi:hypothetical protein
LRKTIHFHLPKILIVGLSGSHLTVGRIEAIERLMLSVQVVSLLERLAQTVREQLEPVAVFDLAKVN